MHSQRFPAFTFVLITAAISAVPASLLWASAHPPTKVAGPDTAPIPEHDMTDCEQKYENLLVTHNRVSALAQGLKGRVTGLQGQVRELEQALTLRSAPMHDEVLGSLRRSVADHAAELVRMDTKLRELRAETLCAHIWRNWIKFWNKT
jgi:hypothetical protein